MWWGKSPLDDAVLRVAFDQRWPDIGNHSILRDWAEYNQLPCVPVTSHIVGATFSIKPREVTAVDGTDFRTTDAQAAGLHYSLDVSLKNSRVSPEKREAAMQLMLQQVEHTKVMMDLLLGPDLCTVVATVTASNTGRRTLQPAVEDTHE